MKTGLFLSRDDGMISGTVDVDALASEYSYLPIAKTYDNFFSFTAQQDILKIIDENSLDAVVLAGNSPKYYDRVSGGSLILEALKKHGINENKIAFANIKEQVALPHKGENGKATKKAKLLIDVALEKVEMCHNIKSITVAPRKSVLVIGTTAGGIIAAKELLEKGYKVYLIERLSSIRKQVDTDADFLPVLTAVQSSDKATIMLETNVKDVSGWFGEYKIILTTPTEEKEICAGGIILALGDDKEWTKELKPKLQLDIDSEGFLVDKRRRNTVGRTKDAGVRFIPFVQDDNLLSTEMNSASVALSLITVLDENEIEHPVLVSEVDESVCGGCGTCVKTCAFSASSIDLIRRVSVIDSKRCKGCGNCVVSCPTGARDLVSFPEKYIMKAIEILSQGIDSSEPKVLVMLCNCSGYSAADSVGELPDLKYPLNVMPLMVECGGNVDTQYVLSAFSKGFDGVAISVCKDGHCCHVVGNTDMERRMGLFRAILRSRNINDERLRVINVSPYEGKLFNEEITAFCEELKAEMQ
jgi:heterodisulfide reductase subunit A-like polyferredoxin/coenzyme F420-reducing hydrogenase delta subunit